MNGVCNNAQRPQISDRGALAVPMHTDEVHLQRRATSARAMSRPEVSQPRQWCHGAFLKESACVCAGVCPQPFWFKELAPYG